MAKIVTLDEVRQLLRKEAADCALYKNTSGIKRWCKLHNVNHPHASEFVNGLRLPPKDLLEALGLEWQLVRKCP